MAQIILDGVSKIYPDGTRAVNSIDLDIADGEFMVFVGPSGCGKTTALRMVAGLEDISEGTLSIGGRVVNDVQPKDRDIAMVFQSYALYPHMSIFDNLAFGLKLRKMKKDEIDKRVRHAAGILGLEEHLDKKPGALSGGQRQRVAMGRAIVREPQAFLMDEPLSNLDAKLRVQTRTEIARLQDDLGVTTIYVTHDQVEAMTMGDRVAVLRKGGFLQQVDPPQVLYDKPKNLFVAGFIGSPAMNLAEAELVGSREGVRVRFGGQELGIDERCISDRPRLHSYEGKRVIIGLRPENINDAALETGYPEDRRMRGVVELREALGSDVVVHFKVAAPPVVTDEMKELAADVDHERAEELEAAPPETMWVARLAAQTRAQVGQPVEFAVDTRRMHFFDPATGEGIY